MNTNYTNLQISNEEALQITLTFFNISGSITKLPGELDFNFKLQTEKASYLLKISRPDADVNEIDFQKKMLEWVAEKSQQIQSPQLIKNLSEQVISEYRDANDHIRIIRLLSWMPGRLWSSVHPQNAALLQSLGQEAGKLTQTLLGFEHHHAQRSFD